MLMFRVAFRNIFRQRRRSLLTFLTILMGFVLSSIAIGLTYGTFNDVVNNFTRTNLGHIQIHEKDYLDRPSLQRTVDDYQKIGRFLERLPDVDAWAPRLYAAGLGSLGEKTSAVQIIGIDPELEIRASRFNDKVVEGKVFLKPAANETILGRGLAKFFQARLGEEVVVVSQAADGSIANAAYRIAGIVETGDVEKDRTAFYLPLHPAQELFVMENRVHEIAVVAKKLSRVEPLAAQIIQVLHNPHLSVLSWKEFARQFYQAMMRDRRNHTFMTYIILLIVAIGVLNTILMAVLERRREYGILKAVGTRPRQIFKLIVLEAGLLSVLSIVGGSVLSYGINSYLATRGFSYSQSFSFAGMQFSRAYSEVSLPVFVIPAFTVLVFTFIVALFPAFKASRTDPAKAMRLH